MTKRKNLNDDIYGDRADIRGGPVKKSILDDFDLDEIYSTKKGLGSGGYNKTYSGFSTKSYGPHCYESHPPLKMPGSELVIYGGSCSHPMVKDADIYIGFDRSMNFTERCLPWKKGAEFLFHIPDMGIPAKVEEFQKLVAWTRKQLDAGLKVHCGCIGGHGRTGTFLAALVSTFGETDAIAYVRKNYCKKAVESKEQVSFLVKHFGLKAATGYKEGGLKDKKSTAVSLHESSLPEHIAPVEASYCIWGRRP